MFTNLAKKYIKILVAVALMMVLVAPSMPALSARSNDDHAAAEALIASIGTRNAPRRPGAMGLRITGQIPDGRAVADATLRADLTTRFAAQASAFAQTHQASALEISHNVEFFVSQDGNFVSVVLIMEATSATTTATAATTVINVITNRIVTLDQFDAGARALIDNHIRIKIDANPRGFVPNFGGIGADHAFYIDGNHLVVPFGSAKLVPTERAVHTVSLSLDSFRGLVVTDAYFFQLPAERYNVIMVRLTPILTHFDYDFAWHSDTRSITIYDGDRPISTVTVGENAFYYGRSAVRELEAAPTLRIGRTYVPLSFFDEMMGMSTTVNLANGEIIISRYMAGGSSATGAFIETTLQ